jgi:hypothetical protein
VGGGGVRDSPSEEVAFEQNPQGEEGAMWILGKGPVGRLM